MKKIKEFNKKNVGLLHDEFNEVMKNFCEKRGLVFTPSNLTYGPNEIRTKVTFLAVGKKKNSSDSDEKTLFINQLKKSSYGITRQLTESDYGKEITMGGKHLKVIALNLRKRKYFILIEEIKTGKKYNIDFNSYDLRR